ncbi:MAG TPA: DUF3419 family protein [Bacteroidia bacterium]|nr:DUF3419 family protein [Bacteroidia bacterium]
MNELKNIGQEIIKYANCWEDADLLLSTVPANPGKIFSIGSGGDNSFALVTKNTPEVVVVDISPVQLYLIELKKTAIQHLTWEEYLDFAGFRHAVNRGNTYRLLHSNLTAGAKKYWDNQPREIETGIIHCGKFERYFKLFRKFILPLTQSKKTIERLFTEESFTLREEFYNRHWNNLRWKLLSGLFFSRFMQARLGRTPEFLQYAGNKTGKTLRDNIRGHLLNPESAENYFLEYIINGNFNRQLPFYTRREHYYTIKERLHCIRLVQGAAGEVIGREKGMGFYNFSNIFEYMDAETFRAFGALLVQNTGRDAIFVYWNLFTERCLNQMAPDKITTVEHVCPGADKGFFYSRFLTDKRC